TYTLSAWTSWQLLFGPGTERLTYLIIAPFAAWAVVTSFLEHRHQWLGAAAFVTTFFLGAGSAERILVRVAPAAIALQPVGLLLSAAWRALCAASKNSRKKTPAGPEPPLENPSRLAA